MLNLPVPLPRPPPPSETIEGVGGLLVGAMVECPTRKSGNGLRLRWTYFKSTASWTYIAPITDARSAANRRCTNTIAAFSECTGDVIVRILESVDASDSRICSLICLSHALILNTTPQAPSSGATLSVVGCERAVGEVWCGGGEGRRVYQNA